MSDEPRMRIIDMPSFTVRLMPDMRKRLEREAFANGRSLSQEVSARIKASFEAADAGARTGVQEPAPDWMPGALTPSQKAMLDVFDSLTPEKQLALLTLLRR